MRKGVTIFEEAKEVMRDEKAHFASTRAHLGS